MLHVQPKQKRNFRWYTDDNTALTQTFYGFIKQKDSYPNKKTIMEFLNKHPDILRGFSDEEKLVKIRVKLNNEKRLRLDRKKKDFSKIKLFNVN